MTVFAAAFQAACALAALARYSPIASEAGLPLSKNPHGRESLKTAIECC
jgi:hypothetical protein